MLESLYLTTLGALSLIVRFLSPILAYVTCIIVGYVMGRRRRGRRGFL